MVTPRQPDPPDLSGIGVLVTRPEEQAASLCNRIVELGGNPILFPALAIAGPENPAAVASLLAGLERYQIAIFISANAVHHGLRLLPEGLPGELQIAAVGKGTLRALQEHGITARIVPLEQFDSEGLLAHPALAQSAGQRILIFRGNGGRELLRDTLLQRGAEVEYAEVYRRVRPQTDPAPLLGRWPREIQITVVTSIEILENLAAILGEQGMPLLQATPMVVVSERIRQRAAEMGCKQILLARRAEEEAILDAILDWRKNGTTE